MNSDWHKIFQFSIVQNTKGNKVYQVKLKYNGQLIGCGTSPDLVGAHSVAFNWFHNIANQKQVHEALFEYNILDQP